jgi:hypothetical protein
VSIKSEPGEYMVMSVEVSLLLLHVFLQKIVFSPVELNV